MPIPTQKQVKVWISTTHDKGKASLIFTQGPINAPIFNEVNLHPAFALKKISTRSVMLTFPNYLYVLIYRNMVKCSNRFFLKNKRFYQNDYFGVAVYEIYSSYFLPKFAPRSAFRKKFSFSLKTTLFPLLPLQRRAYNTICNMSKMFPPSVTPIQKRLLTHTF